MAFNEAVTKAGAESCNKIKIDAPEIESIEPTEIQSSGGKITIKGKHFEVAYLFQHLDWGQALLKVKKIELAN